MANDNGMTFWDHMKSTDKNKYACAAGIAGVVLDGIQMYLDSDFRNDAQKLEAIQKELDMFVNKNRVPAA